MSGKLDGQAAIITGGGRGIGRYIALRFAAEGAAVALAATGAAALETTAQEIRAGGGRALAIQTDVADERAVAELVRKTAHEFGRIDVLVNNSGIAGPTGPATELQLRDWQRTLDINLTGALLCAKHAAPHMIERRSGRIINVTSVAGLIGYAYRTPYAASKWGMIGLTRSLALELGEFGITVNAIAPGAVHGDRIDAVIQSRARAVHRSAEEIEREFFVEPTALKRMVEPEEVAATALFLASEEARSITGDTIQVSSGFRI